MACVSGVSSLHVSRTRCSAKLVAGKDSTPPSLSLPPLLLWSHTHKLTHIRFIRAMHLYGSTVGVSQSESAARPLSLATAANPANTSSAEKAPAGGAGGGRGGRGHLLLRDYQEEAKGVVGGGIPRGKSAAAGLSSTSASATAKRKGSARGAEAGPRRRQQQQQQPVCLWQVCGKHMFAHAYASEIRNLVILTPLPVPLSSFLLTLRFLLTRSRSFSCHVPLAANL